MPNTWGVILKELIASAGPGKPPQYDQIRRKYLLQLHEYTKRPVILYASRFTTTGGTQFPPDVLAINDEDMYGFMEVMHGLASRELDLILHSPGGSLEAAEAIVTYLRSKFKDIRVIVPHLALSAAAMISCASNRILMGKHSFLGPTDPQLFLSTGTGQRMVSAEAILEQFDQAQKQCKDPTALGGWIPILNQYGPDLLVKCQHACDVSKNLVKGWLKSYMLKGTPNAAAKAEKIASWIATHKNFKTHGRHLPRTKLQRQGMIIEPLEKDRKLQDLVLSVLHATSHTFNGCPAAKIIENHNGAAFVKMIAQQQQAIPVQFLQQPPPQFPQGQPRVIPVPQPMPTAPPAVPPPQKNQ